MKEKLLQNSKAEASHKTLWQSIMPLNTCMYISGYLYITRSQTLYTNSHLYVQIYILEDVYSKTNHKHTIECFVSVHRKSLSWALVLSLSGSRRQTDSRSVICNPGKAYGNWTQQTKQLIKRCHKTKDLDIAESVLFFCLWTASFVGWTVKFQLIILITNLYGASSGETSTVLV